MLVAPRQIELREEAPPEAPPGGIVVRVRAALTDGTDLKTYRRGHPKMPMPTRFGHEFSGDVAAIGEGVTAFAPGDPVMCTHTAPCGECFWCRALQEELCEHVMPTMILGAYSDLIVVPKRVVDRNAFLKPAGVSYAEGGFPRTACMRRAFDRDARAGAGLDRRRSRQRRLRHSSRAFIAARRRQGDALRPPGRALGARARTRIAQHRYALGADSRRDRSRDGRPWSGRGRSNARAPSRCGRRAPSLVRRGGRVSFFAGLPGEARVSFLAARLHYDEVQLVAPFHFRPADVREAFVHISTRELPLTRLISHTYPLDRNRDRL